MKDLTRAYQAARQFLRRNGRRFAVLEGNRACNRHCSYCAVPNGYDSNSEATLEETCRSIDWLHAQGYRLMTWLGGEPLALYRNDGFLPAWQM